MARSIRDTSILELLPDQMRRDPSCVRLAACFDPLFQETNAAADKLLLYEDLASLPDDTLAILALQLGADFFFEGLSSQGKAKAIEEALCWQRKKGTRWAVRHALRSFGYEPEIITYQDSTDRYLAKGGKLLDGSWEVSEDTEAFLLPCTFASCGAPGLSHWAEFAVTVDEEQRVGMAKAIQLAKPTRSVPVYYYQLTTRLEAGSHLEASFHSEILASLHPWKSPILDGTWSVDRDSSTLLGELDLEARLERVP
jgi:hypothetical protein